MRLEGKGETDLFINKSVYIVDSAILALFRQISDNVTKLRTGCYEAIGQGKHLLKSAVGDNKAQFLVMQGNRLFDQVQPRQDHVVARYVGHSHGGISSSKALQCDSGKRAVRIR